MACSVFEISKAQQFFDSFAIFHFINGNLSYTDRHLFVPDGEITRGVQSEKLSLKELFSKIFRTKSNSLVSAPFHSALLLFLAGKESLERSASQKYAKT